MIKFMHNGIPWRRVAKATLRAALNGTGTVLTCTGRTLHCCGVHLKACAAKLNADMPAPDHEPAPEALA
ncbi:MAG: hypothetical protein ABI318_12625 [Chthoniobacteraceae bacterium]